MTATVLEPVDALDFDADVPCESLWCDDVPHPAEWYVVTHCRGVRPFCEAPIEQRRRFAGRMGICAGCGVPTVVRPPVILGPVRSP